jgi:hypothetical protein
MPDIVNDYFKRFYPPQELINEAHPVMLSTSTGIGRRVEGFSNVFPDMVMADGFRMSVQGHHGAYSSPRDDWADSYSLVEIMMPDGVEPLLAQYRAEECGSDAIYAYVPIAVVLQIIENHCGLADAGYPTETA